MHTRITAQAEIVQLKKKIEELEKCVSVKTPHDLADLLHEKMCHYNHADGCGWHYEMKNGHHDWSGNAHHEYLKKAQRMLNVVNDPELIAQLIEAYQN